MPTDSSRRTNGPDTRRPHKGISHWTVYSTIALLCAVFSLFDSARAQTGYTFTRIAETPLGSSCVGVNNDGLVIFNVPPSAGTLGTELWRGDGQTVARVAQNVTTICGSINDSGEIAYGTADLATSNVGRLVKNSNGVLTTLAQGDSSPFFAQNTTDIPAINASGSVLFQGGCSGRPWGIHVAPVSLTVYDCTDFLFNFTEGSSMNDNHVVVFSARVEADGSVGIYRGAGTTPLVPNTGVLGTPVINNADTVAFHGFVNGNPAIYRTSDGVTFTRVNDPSVGLPQGPRFSINDSGAVAYEGSDGIYVGPGPLRRIIGFGDLLDGSTVSSTRLWPEGLNDRGELAFLARLADGRQGIYRAEPPDSQPPTVTAPSPISISSTEPGGARGNASTVLAAFLAGGTAVDNVDPNPERLAPQVNGLDTDEATLFTTGATSVTFRFQDARGNVGTATSTVEVTAPVVCASDVTSLVTFSDGRIQLNKRTGIYTLRLRVTLANDGPTSISGPVSFVLDDLPPGVILLNGEGTTSCASPAGSAYINVDIGSDNVWSRKERIAVDLQFSSPSSSITFGRRILAGPGER